MFGSHLSISGGLHNALIEAHELGMDCVQIFTKNPRTWNPKPLVPRTDVQSGGFLTKNQRHWNPKNPRHADVELWHETQKETGVGPAVSHDSYLINMANPSAEKREKSMALFCKELENCEAMGIPYLVTHPGAHLGEGEDAGIAQYIESLNAVHDRLPGLKVLTCLEATAGQGTCLGHRLEHLQKMIAGVKAPERLGVCLDTAHLFAAGYDLSTQASTQAVLDEVEQTIGLTTVKVMHLNDSKVPCGKRVDRHDHIGQGHIGLDAFRVIVNDPYLSTVPKIMETPKDDAPDGRPWDVVNLEVLRGLIA